MTIARIEKGGIVELREMSLDDVPEHKRKVWLSVVGDIPKYNPSIEILTGPTYTIEPDKVVRAWIVERRPIVEQLAAVKNEANRRIVLRYPEYKQRNTIRRGFELLAIQTGFMLDDSGNQMPARALTEAEKGEMMEINKIWDWITLMRSKSDALEGHDPIPTDYTESHYWPGSDKQSEPQVEPPKEKDR